MISDIVAFPRELAQCQVRCACENEHVTVRQRDEGPMTIGDNHARIECVPDSACALWKVKSYGPVNFATRGCTSSLRTPPPSPHETKGGLPRAKRNFSHVGMPWTVHMPVEPLATLLPHFQITTFATRGWRQVAEYRISSIVARSENISQNISDNSPLKSCFFFFFLLFSLHSVCRFSLKKFADFLYLSHCL